MSWALESSDLHETLTAQELKLGVSRRNLTFLSPPLLATVKDMYRVLGFTRWYHQFTTLDLMTSWGIASVQPAETTVAQLVNPAPILSHPCLVQPHI